VAQQCLDDELAKRGLHAAAEEVPEEDESAANEPSAEEEELAVVATYDDAEEADGAKALLDEAKIPSRLVKDAADMEGTQMELLVPATDLFKALDTLGLHLSDEELAAQAEAAGMELDE
jgi:hypothetical protein